MALAARQIRVGTRQHEPGRGVVEACRQPCGGTVALVTGCPELAIVLVIFFVARVASGIEGGEDVIGVTFSTLQAGVCPG